MGSILHLIKYFRDAEYRINDKNRCFKRIFQQAVYDFDDYAECLLGDERFELFNTELDLAALIDNIQDSFEACEVIIGERVETSSSTGDHHFYGQAGSSYLVQYHDLLLSYIKLYRKLRRINDYSDANKQRVFRLNGDFLKRNQHRYI